MIGYNLSPQVNPSSGFYAIIQPRCTSWLNPPTLLGQTLGQNRRVSPAYKVAFLFPAVRILEANDIVLAQISSGLNFDDVQGNLAGVFQAVP
jgi:hypothetical protein